MSKQSSQVTFSTSQHLLYAFIGFIIWVIGVLMVRLLGATFFTPGSALLVVMFVSSIPFGFVIQYAIPPLIKQPLKNTLIPIFVMTGTALLCDGLGIAFSNVYSSDIGMKMVVGGWLLWTFGLQIIITLIIVGRANNKS